MKFYHRVPKNKKFDSLMSLNSLEHLDQTLYNEYNHKYLHRLVLKGVVIPHLGCLWNDVIHMSTVHPADLKVARQSAGFDDQNRSKWFEICPIEQGFTKENSVIYFYTKAPKSLKEVDPEQFRPFDLEQLSGLEILRDEVISYYRECSESNRQPMAFHLVPHILYKGSLYFQDLNVIEV